MGKLVLTRRAGESVKLIEPNGREWLLTTKALPAYYGRHKTHLIIDDSESSGREHRYLLANESIMFAGGNVELRPHKRTDQAILAFDFPRDVTIVRTEIA